MKIHHYGFRSKRPLCGTDLKDRLDFSKTFHIEQVTCETCLSILGSIVNRQHKKIKAVGLVMLGKKDGR